MNGAVTLHQPAQQNEACGRAECRGQHEHGAGAEGDAVANPMRFHALTRPGPKRRPVELLLQRFASL